MGLEKERADTILMMDEDEFNRSIGPILSKEGKVNAAGRDPNDMSALLKVAFEDVIAEPVFTRSFDSVWIGSHAAFELLRFTFYQLLTALLAVPVAFLLGVMFAVLSCIRIWLLMPLTRSFLMVIPSARVVWQSLTGLLVAPLYRSVGKILSSIRMKTLEN
ncbi:caveolin-2 [Brachionichthys hirsutus]|uniref:caveolin-2 n=1 Tax=Brachionichthys hirsutus TaxID=412623 RepID=UPI00360532F3